MKAADVGQVAFRPTLLTSLIGHWRSTFFDETNEALPRCWKLLDIAWIIIVCWSPDPMVQFRAFVRWPSNAPPKIPKLRSGRASPRFLRLPAQNPSAKRLKRLHLYISIQYQYSNLHMSTMSTMSTHMCSISMVVDSVSGSRRKTQTAKDREKQKQKKKRFSTFFFSNSLSLLPRP